jgi:hypothetical protein
MRRMPRELSELSRKAEALRALRDPPLFSSIAGVPVAPRRGSIAPQRVLNI